MILQMKEIVQFANVKVTIIKCSVIADNPSPIWSAWIPPIPAGKIFIWIAQTFFDGSQSFHCTHHQKLIMISTENTPKEQENGY